MRLTEKSRWSLRAPVEDLQTVRAIRSREAWMDVIRGAIPDEPFDALELGCSPGTLMAALIEGTKWRPYGIDYSDDADAFVRSCASIGKQATLYKGDVFDTDVGRDFDLVFSFGLIEHFRGADLDQLLEIHHNYVRKGGFVVIVVPNFTGYQYLWHYIFDRPDLDNHNVDVMHPETFKLFESLGYRIIHKDYHGVLRVWGNSGWLGSWFTGKSVAALAHTVSGVAKLLSKVGIKLTGRSFAPYLLFIGQRTD